LVIEAIEVPLSLPRYTPDSDLLGLAVNSVALTSACYKVKESLSVPVMLYQSLVVTVVFKSAEQVKDKIPEETD